jgi:hypothetical protein
MQTRNASIRLLVQRSHQALERTVASLLPLAAFSDAVTALVPCCLMIGLWHGNSSLGESVASGQAYLEQALHNGLLTPCPTGAQGTCGSTLSMLLVETLIVLATFCASCWAGWQFSQYYFTSAISQVCTPQQCHGRLRALASASPATHAVQ